ncbi:MAG: hypothetical protein KKH41_03770 [Candidatus Thermoplasmatota archaeon]|nr:hypothetical protein [Euryarchaeota archaeon]MBU4031609.1 hypothetical protein [Candidatus Thermoplasmatota archaeon]MBU4072394.1 hypothetical protein [Candidatus Thermoplasmatota archaeon]MBU4144929.1 hypothetical protein [Candidatus Thermoplasmatota archaeon]MBU4591684.1 hypothetical protein [Candidatus Thermoplasmatota archaeon]
MENATKLILAIVGIGILLGILFTPFALIVAGGALWIILWIAQGGMAEGNPYKRMNMRGGLPNWTVVNQYQKNEEIEVRDRGSYYTAVFFFTAGLILIVIGVIWMWLNGSFG